MPFRPVVLIVAAADMEAEAYRAYCLENVAAHYDVVLITDAEPTWERPYLLDWEVADPTDQAALSAAALALAERHPVAGVMTWTEWYLVPVARLARRLGLPTPGPEVMQGCRDKATSRALFAQHAVPSATSNGVRTVAEAARAAQHIGYPIVLKPAARAASAGVIRVDTPEELPDAYAFAAQAARFGAEGTEVLVEEYLDGPEVSVECVTYHGTTTVVAVTRKTVGLPPYFEEIAHAVDAADPLLATVAPTAQAAVQALGVTDGVSHVELRLVDGRPRLIEVNARLGGDMIGHLVHLATGIDLARVAADIACGRAPDLTRTHSRAAAIRMIYPAHPHRTPPHRRLRRAGAVAGAGPLPPRCRRPVDAAAGRRPVHRPHRVPDHHRPDRRRGPGPFPGGIPPPHCPGRPASDRRPRGLGHVSTTTAHAPVHGRRLLTGYFAALGVVMAVWGARMPAVQQAADLSTAGLALVLLAAAVGMVIGLHVGGRLAAPAREPLLLTSGAAGLAAALAVIGVCRTPLTLALGAFVFGIAHGVLDVALNAAAVRYQDRLGRFIMSSLHAAYSLGALGGAGLAALSAHTSHTWLFAVTGLAVASAAVAMAPVARTLGMLEPTTPAISRRTPDPKDSPGLPRARLWLLGALAAACLLGEGAAADWAAVHLHSLDASTAVSASAFALYSASMVAGRLAGDRLIAHFGAPMVVRIGAVLAAAGLTAGLALATVPAALAGWAALGLGLSVTIPSLITAAGRGGPGAVATVSVTGYAGLLAGPALIGALATLTALPHALLLPALLAAAVAALSLKALENPTP